MASVDPRKDNGKLEAKLTLRRYMLDRWHSGGDIRVFDACQGSGVIWKKMRNWYKLTSYWGVDLKKKSGRLQADSVELLSRGLPENVIDVDAYGSPWAHWEALLRTTKQPRTVFLTIGEFGVRQRPLSRAEARLLGIEPFFQEMPERLKLRLARTSSEQLISLAEVMGFKIDEVVEADRGKTARYIGVRLSPLPA
jgi:hypothetical protein